jgi:hypothetical protein
MSERTERAKARVARETYESGKASGRAEVQARLRAADALAEALRRFNHDGPTIISNEITYHYGGCDGHECQQEGPVLDAYRCKLARAALAEWDAAR